MTADEVLLIAGFDPYEHVLLDSDTLTSSDTSV